LTLAVSQPRVYLFSLRREPLLTDFYAEITARLGLCSGPDEYGLLFRVNSAGDFYRFALTCTGEMRLDRVRSSQASLVYPRAFSGDVPPGAPGEVRIGVWAVGREMRFFLNDHYQFTVRDPVFRSGTLGVFARSGGETAVTVSFSDLIIRSVSYLSPTPSPTPSRTPTPTRTPRATP
jgi:hypothetical protein